MCLVLNVADHRVRCVDVSRDRVSGLHKFAIRVFRATSNSFDLHDGLSRGCSDAMALDRIMACHLVARMQCHSKWQHLTSPRYFCKPTNFTTQTYTRIPPSVSCQEDRITLNNGGTLAPTKAPGGMAGTGTSAMQEALLPPPQSFEAQKRSEER